MFVFDDSSPHYTTTVRIFSELPAKHVPRCLLRHLRLSRTALAALSRYGNLRKMRLYLIIPFGIAYFNTYTYYCQYLIKTFLQSLTKYSDKKGTGVGNMPSPVRYQYLSKLFKGFHYVITKLLAGCTACSSGNR